MHEALIVLLFFIAFAALFDRLGFGTILGFLVAGAAIGPSGLGVIEELEAVRHLAELGVIFLLFNFGLELKAERLRQFGARVYMLAITQLLVTIVVIAAMAHLLGLPAERAVVMGGALALSSTAIVFQVLRQQGQELTQLGYNATAILLVQDLAVGPLLVVVEVMSEQSEGIWLALAIAAVKAVLVLTVVVATARYLLRPLFNFIATISASEVFTATTLVVVLGASFATEAAGLSMALGAFVAGFMVADTEYRHQVAADIAPFRGLLLGFFFMTVGMTIDPSNAVDNFGVILMVAGGLVALKCILIMGLAIGLGFPVRQSMLLGGLLSQGSEFAFVLLGLAATTGLLVGGDVQVLTVAVALSMSFTAVVIPIIMRRQGTDHVSDPDQRTDAIVAGFGRCGQTVFEALTIAGVRTVAVATDAKLQKEMSERIGEILFGDPSNPEFLRTLISNKTKFLILAIEDTDLSILVARTLRIMFPDLTLHALANNSEHAEHLRSLQIETIRPSTSLASLELARFAVR